MRFLYKIYSNYDGFIPQKIEDRMEAVGNRSLRLGWGRYLDLVSLRDECWVYFHGSHLFENGVYAKGTVANIDYDTQRVTVRLREYSLSGPLTDHATSVRVAQVVAQRGRQVFVWPEHLALVPDCSLSKCRKRLCEECPTTRRFNLLDPADLSEPPRLGAHHDLFVPAYWIVPNRCYLHMEGKIPSDAARAQSEMFYQFKAGQQEYAYPLALGVWKSLARLLPDLDFDFIVPVPLSPDKLEAGEFHRTLRLAKELAKMAGTPVLELAELSRPISKRRFLAQGGTTAQFERKYRSAITVTKRLGEESRLLIVDDVCTRGSTLSQLADVLASCCDSPRITFATAGQMIVKAVVSSEQNIVA